MAGFRSVKQYTDAWEAGRSYTAFSRDFPSSSPNTAPFLDFSTIGGGPPANYYASTPLLAATLDGTTGIYYGDNKAPARRFLTHWSLTGAGNAWAGQYFLQDILLYYPFFDGDDLTVQTTDNSVTLPRYTDGDGLQVYAVTQSSGSGGGSLRFTYVNQNGVEKVSPTQFVNSLPVNPGSSMNTGTVAASGTNFPFAMLSDGDSGIRSVTSVQVMSAIGGLFGMVIVKPLASMRLPEGSCEAHQELITMKAGPPRVYDGAYLGLLGRVYSTIGNTGLLGMYNFIWDEGT